MPKGPRGERRPADIVGCAVSVAKIATGEMGDNVSPSNRRKSGKAGAKARMESIGAERRSDIATKAAQARWEKGVAMEHMTFDQRFQKAFDGGLADVKFFVRRSGIVTADELRADALAFQEAIDCGKVKQVDGVD